MKMLTLDKNISEDYTDPHMLVSLGNVYAISQDSLLEAAYKVKYIHKI